MGSKVFSFPSTPGGHSERLIVSVARGIGWVKVRNVCAKANVHKPNSSIGSQLTKVSLSDVFCGICYDASRCSNAMLS